MASTLAISPLPLFTYSIVTVFSWLGDDLVGHYGITDFEPVGLRPIGTEILTSDWLEERALASTYSYRKFTVTGWAPLFAVGERLHRHALRHGVTAPQRVDVERVRASRDGEALAAVHGDDHVRHRHLTHVLEGEVEVEIGAGGHGIAAIGEVGDDDVRHRAGDRRGIAVASLRRTVRAACAVCAVDCVRLMRKGDDGKCQ